MEPGDWIALSVFILITFLQIESPAYKKNSDFYKNKSSSIDFAPPAWVFPVVWYILYSLMTSAIFIIWKNEDNLLNDTYYSICLSLYGLNLFFNKIWTILFFTLRNYLLAIIDIFIILITSIIILILLAKSDFWLPFGLLIFYPIWSLFALYISFRLHKSKKQANVKK